MATSLIKNFIAKTLFRQKGAIANNKAVDFSANALETRLKNFGVDVNGIQNEKQLNEILAIIKQREDNMFAQQFGDVLSKRKSAKVFDLEGKEIKNPKNIMGGKAFEPQGLSDKEFRSEKTSFRLNISKNSPEFNQDLAKKIINREIYTDLSDSQRKQFLDDLDFVLKNPRDGNAQGGRAGFKSGLSKLFKEFMERRKFLKTMVGNTEKNRKARELQMLKEAMENARKNPGFEFPSGKELRTDLEKKIGPILLKDRTLNSDGGRAGFSRGGSGILKFLQNILKPKKSRIFDEERFRKGPIDMDFLENIDKKDLEKFITTRDTGGRGGYGMYDNFKDMPAGLRAAELISTIKGPRNEINYKAAELFLGKKLRGDESADELIQILNSQEMRAEGGRAGYKFGIGPLFKLLSKKSPKQAYTDYLKSVKDRAQKGDMKSLAPELGAVTATGVFINRRMKDILENMKNQDMENNLENFKKELDADPFYKEYPEIKDKMIEGYTEMMFGEKKAEGGRAGFANGTGAPSIILNPKEESMGPEFETNDPGEAAKEIIKRLIRVEGAKIPLTEKGLLSLNIDNLDEQSIGGIIDLLGGELQFGVGRGKEGKGAGFTFKKQFEHGELSVKQTVDGGFIIAGHDYLEGGSSWGNVWLSKLDKYGNKEWENTYSLGAFGYTHSVIQTSDGGYLYAGWEGIVKADSNGLEQWKNKNSGNSSKMDLKKARIRFIEIANKIIAIVKTNGNHGMASANAIEVKTAPSTFSPSIITSLPYSNIPPLLYIIITRAVIVQITTVSIKGSNNATTPSEAAYFVFTAECAIEADPAPASFENAAL